MANIIGEPINSVISDQIKTRQKAHGSGSPGNERTPEYHSYLNSKTAWFKLASATVVDKKRLEEEKLDTTFTGIEFSKNHILYSGVSRVDLDQQKLIPKGTRNDINNIWDYYDGTYTVNASADRANNISEFGLVPMPGVESVDIQCLNRGSIKKASVKIKCYSPQQFKILDLLYLRIGYTVFLEWGWAPYLNNEGTLVHDYYTLIEQKDKGFFDWGYWQKQGYRPFLDKIENWRNSKHGNYDGLLCRVTNFSWTFAQDGTYDIELQLITLGDVVESLKTNITPNRKMLTNISSLYKIFNDSYIDEDSEEAKENPPAPIQDWISSYFFLNKLVLFQERDTYGYWYNRDITCKIADVPINVFGVFLNAAKRTGDGISQSDYKYFWWSANKDTFISELKADGFTELDIVSYATTDTPGSYYSVVPLQGGIVNVGGWLVYYSTKIEADEIFKEQAKKDMVYLHWNSQEGDEDVVNNQGFYIRFGHLLQIINRYIIPVEETSEKHIIEISTDPKENKMYIFPYQVSLDPRVCIISNYNEPVNSKEYYLTLEPCKILSTKSPYGRTMNIYLNCQKVEEIISNNLDDKGNLDLFSLLESICSELNKALGGINNFEPVIDETTNTLYIVDGSYSEPQQPEYALELYGYNQNNIPQQGTIVSNFVRDFSIKTELTNDFATMATVGSTAGGYVKGTENTMFSKWNKGLTDRFKEKLVPADPESRNKAGEIDEPNEIYVKEFWNKRYNSFGLTAPQDVVDDATTDDTPNISPELCDKNVSIVTEFYKYCHSKIQENSENPSSVWYRDKSPYAAAVNGFIPISLSITLDGISGIKIYNELNVITRFLPQNYPDSLRFIIKGVNHKLSKNDWETTIETVVIAQNGKQNSKGDPIFTYDELRNQIRELISEGITAAAADEAEANGGAPSTPSSPPPSVVGAWKVWNKGKYISSAYELNAHHSKPINEVDSKNTRSGGWTKTKSGKYVYDVCLFRKENGVLQNKPFVPSPVNGTVIRTSPDSSGNAFLIIKGDDGYEYDLLHMDNYQVKKGDRVVKGQLIARQSNVSPDAYANHLHIQMPTKQSLIDYIDSLINNSF